jgi:hypothetical protein
MEINSKLDEVRKKINEGNKEILLNFIEAVHEPLSVEHRQWLMGFGDKFSAIGRLEQELHKSD